MADRLSCILERYRNYISDGFYYSYIHPSTAFTAQEIFEIPELKCYPVVREIGFGNICFGTIVLYSLASPAFRVPAAVAGGLYMGLAGIQHVVKVKKTGKEIFAMVSDLYIFVVLFLLILLNSGGIY